MKRSIRILGPARAHFAQHVEYPGAFAIDQVIESIWVFEEFSREPRIKPPKSAGTISEASFPAFSCDIFPATHVAGDPGFLAVREKQREIAGHALRRSTDRDSSTTDNVAPPLVRYFVKWNQFVEMFLTVDG